MGLRFRKSITLCKGVRVNFGLKGASVSIGTRGARYTVHSSGRRTASIGVPGTGLYYTESLNPRKRNYRSNAYVVRRHIVGGTYRTLISVQNPLRLCRTGICRSLSAG